LQSTYIKFAKIKSMTYSVDSPLLLFSGWLQSNPFAGLHRPFLHCFCLVALFTTIVCSCHVEHLEQLWPFIKQLCLNNGQSFPGQVHLHQKQHQLNTEKAWRNKGVLSFTNMFLHNCVNHNFLWRIFFQLHIGYPNRLEVDHKFSVFCGFVYTGSKLLEEHLVSQTTQKDQQKAQQKALDASKKVYMSA